RVVVAHQPESVAAGRGRRRLGHLKSRRKRAECLGVFGSLCLMVRRSPETSAVFPGTNPCHGCNILSVRILPLLPVLLAPVAIRFAEAQQTPPTPSASPTASAVGTVFDSIRFRPMSGARVQVDSSALVAT